MRHKIIATVLFLFCLFNHCARAFAWGPDGHQIVASIADLRLNPAVKAQVADLLDNAKMFEVSTWADQIRNDRKETGPWHYVDIPTENLTFDEARDGQNGNNIIDQINHHAAILADRSKPRNDRVESLKFVIHFVGDLHQPLHASERNKDKGGNTRLVFFLDQPQAVNLHGVWDSSILHESMGNTPMDVYASALNVRISPDQAKQWAAGTPEQWANESHKIAIDYVYKDVPMDGPPPKLNHDYVDRAKPIVDLQLQRAGVRLACVLNSALADPPTTQPLVPNVDPAKTDAAPKQ